ncbi:MAG TPA: hypothetical protein VIM46_06545 [Luteolibacter sp.]
MKIPAEPALRIACCRYNRTVGTTGNPTVLEEMKMLVTIAALAVLTSCDSKPVVEKPASNELAGVWECSDFPAEFLTKAGKATSPPRSRILIRHDGSCAAVNFPQSAPYRFSDVANASWQLVGPFMTPSGAWSVELDGVFLQCRRSGGRLELRYHISATDAWTVNYKRQQNTAQADDWNTRE